MDQSIQWLPIPGHDGKYEVSSDGQIRSVLRLVEVQARDGRHTFQTRRGGMILRQHLNPSSGYLQVAVRGGIIHVHQAVAEAFHGPRPDGLHVCHGNGIRTDNHASNLRWDTPSANIRESVAQGTHAKTRITHCPQGHAYDAANTYVKPSTGHRKCRACDRDRKARQRA